MSHLAQQRQKEKQQQRDAAKAAAVFQQSQFSYATTGEINVQPKNIGVLKVSKLMSNPISFEGRVTATQDETESAPATESAPENEQRFAAQTVHSFNFQIMIDRFGQHPPTLLVEEWENRTRYQVPRNRTFSE